MADPALGAPPAPSLAHRLREWAAHQLASLVVLIAPPRTDARSIALGHTTHGQGVPPWMLQLYALAPDEAGLKRILAFVEAPGDAVLEVWIVRRRGEWIKTEIQPPREVYARAGRFDLDSGPMARIIGPKT